MLRWGSFHSHSLCGLQCKLKLKLQLRRVLQGMMDATLACPKFEGQLQVSFTGATGGGLGKRLDNAATQAALCWQPKYPSFKQFMADGGVDVYSLEDAWDA